MNHNVLSIRNICKLPLFTVQIMLKYILNSPFQL